MCCLPVVLIRVELVQVEADVSAVPTAVVSSEDVATVLEELFAAVLEGI